MFEHMLRNQRVGARHGGSSRKLYFACLLSSGVSVTRATSENAAKIFTPGAVISGLIISGKIKFGPNEEEEATTGAA
ncbi:hypothetical protein ACFX1S_040176 [Malus domestica]